MPRFSQPLPLPLCLLCLCLLLLAAPRAPRAQSIDAPPSACFTKQSCGDCLAPSASASAEEEEEEEEDSGDCLWCLGGPSSSFCLPAETDAAASICAAAIDGTLLEEEDGCPTPEEISTLLADDCGAVRLDECAASPLGCHLCPSSADAVCECRPAAAACDDEDDVVDAAACDAAADCAQDGDCDDAAFCAIGHCFCPAIGFVRDEDDQVCRYDGDACGEDAHCGRGEFCSDEDEGTCDCLAPFDLAGGRCVITLDVTAVVGNAVEAELATDLSDAAPGAERMHIVAADGAAAVAVTPIDLSGLMARDVLRVFAGCSDDAALFSDALVQGVEVVVEAACVAIEVIPAVAETRSDVFTVNPSLPLRFSLEAAQPSAADCNADVEDLTSTDEASATVDITAGVDDADTCAAYIIRYDDPAVINGTLAVNYYHGAADAQLVVIELDASGAEIGPLHTFASTTSGRTLVLYGAGFRVHYYAGSAENADAIAVASLTYLASTEAIVLEAEPLGEDEVPETGLICSEFSTLTVDPDQLVLESPRPARACGTPFCFEYHLVPGDDFSSVTLSEIVPPTVDGDELLVYEAGVLLDPLPEDDTVQFDDLVIVVRGDNTCPGVEEITSAVIKPGAPDFFAGPCANAPVVDVRTLLSPNDGLEIKAGGSVANETCLVWTVRQSVEDTARPIVSFEVAMSALALYAGDGFVGVLDGEYSPDSDLLAFYTGDYYVESTAEPVDLDAKEAEYAAFDIEAEFASDIDAASGEEGSDTEGEDLGTPPQSEGPPDDPQPPLVEPVEAMHSIDASGNYVAPVVTIVLMARTQRVTAFGASVVATAPPPQEPMTECVEHDISELDGNSGILSPQTDDPIFAPFYFPAHCEKWYFSSTAWETIRFTLLDLSTQMSDDTLGVFTGANELRGRDLVSYSGFFADQTKPVTVYTLRGEAAVVFRADDKTQFSGFQLQWEGLAERPADVPSGNVCEERTVISELPALITSGGVPGEIGYPDDACMEWLVEPDGGAPNGIAFAFTHLDTQRDDVVTIFDAADPVPPLSKLGAFNDPFAPVLLNVSGQGISLADLPRTTTSVEAAEVLFRSDSMGGFSGFALVAYLPDDDGCVSMPTISLAADGTPLSFSPLADKDGRSPKDLCQRWHIEAVGQDVINLAFDSWSGIDPFDVFSVPSAGGLLFHGDDTPPLGEPFLVVGSDNTVDIEWTTDDVDVYSTWTVSAWAAPNITDSVSANLVGEVCQTVVFHVDQSGVLASRNPYTASSCIEAIIAPSGVTAGKWMFSFDYIDLSDATPLRVFAGGNDRLPVNCTGDGTIVDVNGNEVDCAQVADDYQVLPQGDPSSLSPDAELLALTGKPSSMPDTIFPDATAITVVFRAPDALESNLAGFRLRWQSMESEVYQFVYPTGEALVSMVDEDSADGVQLLNAPFLAGPSVRSTSVVITADPSAGTVDGVNELTVSTNTALATTAMRNVRFVPADNFCGSTSIAIEATISIPFGKTTVNTALPVVVTCVNDQPLLSLQAADASTLGRAVVPFREELVQANVAFSDVDALATVMVEVTTTWGIPRVQAVDQIDVLYVSPHEGVGSFRGRIVIEGPYELVAAAVETIDILLPHEECDDTVEAFPTAELSVTVHDQTFSLVAAKITKSVTWTLDCVRRSKSDVPASAVSFSATAVGDSLGEAVAQIGNAVDAEKDLEITSFTVTSAVVGTFDFADLTGSVVGIGENLTISGTFAPVTYGLAFALIQIETNDLETGRIEISVSGLGLSAALGAYGPVRFIDFSLDFPPVDNPPMSVFSFRNVGNVPLEITSAELAAGSPFSVAASSVAQTVAPGASGAIVLTFLPATDGKGERFASTLSVSSNSLTAPLIRVAVSGSTGFAPLPTFRGVEKDAQQLSQHGIFRSDAQTPLSGSPPHADAPFRITNSGKAPLSINAVRTTSLPPFAATGFAASAFKVGIVEDLPIELAAGETTTVTVRFEFDSVRPRGQEATASVEIDSTVLYSPFTASTRTLTAVVNVLPSDGIVLSCQLAGLSLGLGVAGSPRLVEEECTLTNVGSLSESYELHLSPSSTVALPTVQTLLLDGSNVDASVEVVDGDLAQVPAGESVVIRVTASLHNVAGAVDYAFVFHVLGSDDAELASVLVKGSAARAVFALADGQEGQAIAGGSVRVQISERDAHPGIFVSLEPAPADGGDVQLSLTVGGTATAGSDFVVLPSTLTLVGGSATVLPLEIINDTERELDEETIVLALPGGASAEIVILPSDVATTVTVDVEDDGDDDDDDTEVMIVVPPPQNERTPTDLVVRVRPGSVSAQSAMSVGFVAIDYEIVGSGRDGDEENGSAPDSDDFTWPEADGSFAGVSFAITLSNNAVLVDAISVDSPVACDLAEPALDSGTVPFKLMLFDKALAQPAWIDSASKCTASSLAPPSIVVNDETCLVTFEICHLTQFALSYMGGVTVDEPISDDGPLGVVDGTTSGSAAVNDDDDGMIGIYVGSAVIALVALVIAVVLVARRRNNTQALIGSTSSDDLSSDDSAMVSTRVGSLASSSSATFSSSSASSSSGTSS